MKLAVKISIVLLIIATCTVRLYAQTYPVRVTAQLAPPFTPYLSDLSAVGSQRFMVSFLLNDPTLTEYRGKLRITIEGVGITIRTKQSFIPQQPLILYGGESLIAYGEDLEEYLNPANLDFAGFTRSQYEKGAKLPEGVYRFTVEVLDYNRSTLVSNKGTAVAWIILNDPPLLNLPRTESKVKILDPVNIAFTWTPRHTASPNSAFTAEYIFRLVEVWPITRNPYDAFLSQQPLYETTTNSNQIVYGSAEPALIAGRKYAWQVQAKDVDGRDLFTNDGRSEVYVFQFGDALGIPENLSLQTSNPSSLIVRWEQLTAGTDTVRYRVRYRPRNNRSHDEWYETKTDDQWNTISSLQPNTEYEVQVRAEQSTQVSDYSAVKVFKTAIAGANEFVCKSDVSPPTAPTNTTAARQLVLNDTIHAADYEVLVREITANQGGTYTGSGMMIVPWFQFAKVRMTFKDIRVNEQHWLTAGEIKSVWNAESKFLIKSVKKVDSTNAPLVGEIPVTVVATETLIEITGAAIATVTKDEEGNIEVYTTDGEKKVLPKGKSYSIADEVGNGYVVDKKGNITKTTAEEAREAAGRGDRNYTITLTFTKGDGKLGFDEKKYEALSGYYQQLDGGQYIPWKAVTNSLSDPVAATLEGTNIDPEKVRFEINASPIVATNNGDNYILNVRGGAEGTVLELLALYAPTDTSKDDVLGKLNLVSYDKITRDLVIVPVNGTTVPGAITRSILSQKLTDIYGQAVAAWNVEIKPSITVSLDEYFDDGESGLLTNYTGDMKKVIKAYGNLLDKTYYIFLVTKPKSGATLGYMPRSKQAGFIFADKLNSSNVVNTIAHEIGHGAFNLQHTFKEFPSLSQGSTDNLMDYPNGPTLYKYQWDHIHDPQKVIGLFEDDEDAASINTSYCYLDPAGKPFKFKNGDGEEPGDVILETSKTTHANGTLLGFRLKGIDYMADMAGGIFNGYKTSDNKPYTNAYNSENIGKVRLVHNAGNCTAALLLVSYTKVNNTSNAILTSLAYTVPSETKFVSINGCVNDLKGEIPLNGEAGGTSSNGIVVIDYSQGKDGVSLLSQASRQDLEKQVSDINTQFEISGKVYVLNKENPKYTELLAQAQSDNTPGKSIVTLSKGTDATVTVAMQYSFTPPDWLSDLFPNIANSCADEYIGEGLTTLHNSIVYKTATVDQQIIAEYSTVIYRGVFGVFYCATSEEAVKKSSDATKYIAGAVHELIATVDVAEMVSGLAQLAKQVVKSNIDSYASYISDVRRTFTDVKNNTSISEEVLLQRLMPPGLRQQVAAYKAVVKIGGHFVKFYFTDCADMCPYRYGQVTVMLVPIVLTAGEWVVVKSGALMSRLKALKNAGKALNKTEDVARVLTEAENVGLEIVQNESDVINIVESGVDDAGEATEEVIASVERNGDEVEITTTEQPLSSSQVRKEKLEAKIRSIRQNCDKCANAYKAGASIRNRIKNLAETKRILNDQWIASGKSWDDFIEGYEAHHILPKELLENSEAMQHYFNHYDGDDILKFNHIDNGIMVEKYREGIGGVHGNHPDYTFEINNYIDTKYINYVNDGLDAGIIAQRLHADLTETIATLKNVLIENSINGTVKVNDLHFTQILR
ncbi:fibronectin type III domain-containing protein [Ohtaekwangia koreensis]|uniref:fibronectin type III domain-containing protein n=1 Tax=Ohtaekwangia koreensis TaxID=688867 RepID=UPI0013564057|nr:fibronectin type III domain-containing protein [Ohtaekwangia koreensis]